jgi:hypothetical protein
MDLIDQQMHPETVNVQSEKRIQHVKHELARHPVILPVIIERPNPLEIKTGKERHQERNARRNDDADMQQAMHDEQEKQIEAAGNRTGNNKPGKRLVTARKSMN